MLDLRPEGQQSLMTTPSMAPSAYADSVFDQFFVVDVSLCLDNNNLTINTQNGMCDFRTSHCNVKIPANMNILNSIIEISPDTNFMGVVLDNNLKWNRHVENLIKRLNSVSYTLRVMLRKVDLDVLKTF
ncbi:hypothetical protein WA026_001247 [Henosepilachna vigintioctopunctata]|uniref:Uncharacterized protein n=1 Tax=Henosepilachna vigintioctopunctata TaxID=420089 RepID=A0AAW1UJ25_9CUCU